MELSIYEMLQKPVYERIEQSIFTGIGQTVYEVPEVSIDEPLEERLNATLSVVNQILEDAGKDYQVTYCDSEVWKLREKFPILLQIVRGDTSIPIGMTQFEHLTPEFKEAPFEEIARTIDQLAESILIAVDIHEDVVQKIERGDSDVLITDRGVPFYKNGLDVEFRDGILYIEDMQMKDEEGNPFKPGWLCGQHYMEFSRTEEGHFEAKDPVDERGEGTGMFFNKDTGENFRK